MLAGRHRQIFPRGNRLSPVGATHHLLNNTNAIELSNVGKITPSNKHIELRNHIVRFLIQSQQVQVKWIHTKSNLADIGTKAMKDLQGYELLRNVLVHPRPGKDSE